MTVWVGIGIIKEQRPTIPPPKGLTSFCLVLGGRLAWLEGQTNAHMHRNLEGRKGVTYVVQGRVWGSMGFFLARALLAQA